MEQLKTSSSLEEFTTKLRISLFLAIVTLMPACRGSQIVPDDNDPYMIKVIQMSKADEAMQKGDCDSADKILSELAGDNPQMRDRYKLAIQTCKKIK